MDTTCIIAVSSIFGSLCFFGGLVACCTNNCHGASSANRIKPKCIIITKEHYDALITRANVPLPPYEEPPPPPSYSNPGLSYTPDLLRPNHSNETI